ncbi:MAG: 2,3-bisphosphoglycerate-independent phosphoglycerate mutase [Proteobacteria bacterium]|nr:2,3-bisphosphoglycerate-independent phosphoglycerate mutase [Pseudomonadota bacterium]
MSLHLPKHPDAAARPGPVVVVVMDGVGLGRADEGDAVWLARTPTLDRLKQEPWVPLAAHGTAVGMPSDADMGNSEVGHNALGAGRVFDQGAKLVDESIARDALFEGETWAWSVGGCVGTDRAVHLIGLLSDGNVHSHQDHLHALLERAVADGCTRVYVHPLLDGRDVDATSAPLYLGRLEAKLAELRSSGADCRIASGGGRMTTTMDRYEADWSIVQRGWQAHVLGQGRRFGSAIEAVEAFRAEEPGIGDQFLPEFVVGDADGPVATIEDGDAVLFFNFRGDRAIEISKAFTAEEFDAFDRVRVPDVRYAGMMQYDGDEHVPERFLVDPPAIARTMGEHLAFEGISQLAISETQKYGHVTYFWNGNRSGAFDPAKEQYVEIPSDVIPFEQRPWMKAAEITDELITRLRADDAPAFARVNYANGDMVGHTGALEATVIAVECVDLQLARLLKAVEEVGGAALITADHGNADQMFRIDKKSGLYLESPLTSHTLNAVPLYLFDPVGKATLRTVEGAGLKNVAATALELMGRKAPEDYGVSLISP